LSRCLPRLAAPERVEGTRLAHQPIRAARCRAAHSLLPIFPPSFQWHKAPPGASERSSDSFSAASAASPARFRAIYTACLVSASPGHGGPRCGQKEKRWIGVEPAELTRVVSHDATE